MEDIFSIGSNLDWKTASTLFFLVTLGMLISIFLGAFVLDGFVFLDPRKVWKQFHVNIKSPLNISNRAVNF